jgi:hypothetical protein
VSDPPSSTARFGPGVALVGLAGLALGPVLLHRGYVLVGDMTFVPDQPWKAAWLGLDGSVPRAVPADAAVWLFSQVVPGDLLQKAVLLGTLVLAGLGSLRLGSRIPGASSWARLGGAVLYLWNPYVFERLAIGHWGLLVGYAVLPWVVAAALDVRRDAWRASAGLFLAMLVAAVGSPTGGLVVAAVAVVMILERHRPGRAAVVVAMAAVANLPWLTPAILNDAAPSDPAGVTAFAARADTPLGSWPSLLTFGGIWKRAVVPSERSVSLLVVAALALVVLAAVALVQRRRQLGGLLPGRLALVAVVALLVAGLPSTAAGGRLARHLVDSVPGAGLWRDSQKWLMPVVLVTCLGVVVLLDMVQRRLSRSGLPGVSATVVLAFAPVVLLPSLSWGLAGRLEPVRFPDEWGTVRTILEQQPSADRRTAVLPWSAYQRLPWNDRRAALDPALRFFPGQVVASEELSLGDGVTVHADGGSRSAIDRAISDGRPLGPALAADGVRYLLVERTAPSSEVVALPSGTLLHDGRELVLLDLGGDARLARAPHPGSIVVADVLAALATLAAGCVLIRRKVRGIIGYDRRGSGHNGEDADDR